MPAFSDKKPCISSVVFRCVHKFCRVKGHQIARRPVSVTNWWFFQSFCLNPLLVGRWFPLSKNIFLTECVWPPRHQVHFQGYINGQFWISLFCSKKNGLETNTLACPQPAVRRTLGDDALLATSSSWWLCIRATTHLRPAVGRLTSSPFWKGRNPLQELKGGEDEQLLTNSSCERGQVWLEICSFLKGRPSNYSIFTAI